MNQIVTRYPYIGHAETRKGGREENQDNAGWADTPFGLLVVLCDGLGGGPGGRLASATAIDVIRQIIKNASPKEYTRQQILKAAIYKGNDTLMQIVEEHPKLKGMGTTVAALLINEISAVIAHVGDSRVYKLRLWQKCFCTKDHSMVGEMVRNGTLTPEQARLSNQSNIITKALGASGRCEPDIEELAYEKGDRFLLCSDGIWGAMPESKLVKEASSAKSVASAVEHVANLADRIGMQNGGNHDNLTILIVETKNDSKNKEPMNRKARQILIGLGAALVVSIITNIILLANRPTRQPDLEPEPKQIETVDDVKSMLANIEQSLSKMEQARNNEDEGNSIREKLDDIRDLLATQKGEKTLPEPAPAKDKQQNTETPTDKQTTDTSIVEKSQTTEKPAAGTAATTNVNTGATVSEVRQHALNILKAAEKVCTNNEKECARQLLCKQREFISYINGQLEVNKNLKEEHKKILRAINNHMKRSDKKWDIYVQRNKDKKYVLTMPGKECINELRIELYKLNTNL